MQINELSTTRLLLELDIQVVHFVYKMQFLLRIYFDVVKGYCNLKLVFFFPLYLIASRLPLVLDI